MGEWVVEPFLKEEHILILDKENMMRDFASCSKILVVDSMIEYLETSNNKEVKDIIEEYYKDKISFKEIQKDEEIQDTVSKVYGYNYDSIHAGLTIEQLMEIKSNIKSVYNDDYNVPYENVIQGDVVNGIIDNLIALNRVNKKTEYKKLAYLLSKNKTLFKDKPNARAKGTIFKSVSKKSTELDIMIKGIDFLIEQKSLNRQPESWRVF